MELNQEPRDPLIHLQGSLCGHHQILLQADQATTSYQPSPSPPITSAISCYRGCHEYFEEGDKKH